MGGTVLPSFIATPSEVSDTEVTLRGEEAHHISVRRYGIGDCIDVIDGEGGFYRVRIDNIEQTLVHGLIMDKTIDRGESPMRLHLAAAVVKGHQRFDYVVEKTTEVGVASIQPMWTQRTIPTKNQRIERWQRLAVEAAKQCGRSRVPQVFETVSLEEALGSLLQKCEVVVMASSHRQAINVSPLPTNLEGNVGLLIGPEGGFSESEEEEALALGVQFFKWGQRTLRSDTASVILSALILDRVKINV